MREIILDTETTGLDPAKGHRIIEIGAIEMINKVPTGEVFHHYINPERDVPIEAYQVHGISAEFLKDKPKFSKIADEFLSFVANSSLVIHNAPFDMGFLNYELVKISKTSLELNVIDTLNLARKKYPGQRNSLDALCRRLKIDNSHRTFHGALKDAALLAEVYVELTGGRQIKFRVGNGNDQTSAEQITSNSFHNLDNNNFKIVKPTNEELSEHKQLLSTLSKK